jgi:tetratricopeptide (TPR) repeat protein
LFGKLDSSCSARIMETVMSSLSNSISRFGLLLTLIVLSAFSHAAGEQYVQYGNQMLQQRQYDKAIQYYSAALKADPQNAAAYKGLGYAAMGKRDVSNGIKYMEYALRLNPNDSGLRQYLGKTYQGYGNQYYKRGDKASALAWWKKAVATDPSNTQLAAYVAQLSGAGAAATPSQEPAPTAKAEEPATLSTPGVNPWIMGGTVAVLGAIMLLAF